MNGLTGPPWLFAGVAFVIGAMAGRLLNRCIDRFPRSESLRDQLASVVRVTDVERQLRQAQSIGHRLPIVGWLLPRHPLSRPSRAETLRLAGVELINGLLFAALVWTEFPHGFVAGAPDPFAIEGLEFLAPAGGSLALQLVRLALHLVLVQAILVASAIDLEEMIIPDGSTIPAMLLAVAVATLAGGTWLVPVWYEDASLLATFDLGGSFDGGVEIPAFLLQHPHLHGLLVSLAGLAVGGGIVWSVRIIGHWALGREAMGFGDVILMALIGSVVGWQPVLVIFFLAPLTAVVVLLFAAIVGTNREFPFGPWLSLATVVLLIGWQDIWPHAGRFFAMGRVLAFVGLSILILLAVLLRGWRFLSGDERWYEHLPGDWTSADQLTYQSGETRSLTPRSWQERLDGKWPGIAAGTGSLGEQRWRKPSPPGRRSPGSLQAARRDRMS